MSNAQKHPVRLKAPFYGEDGYGGLHRYLDTEFISRYRQEVANNRFDGVAFSDWTTEEQHSLYDQLPVLRLPLHRTFHIFSCEVGCEQMGEPALCPDRITSAGFVIRRVDGNKQWAWMIEEGEPKGWEQASSDLRDPDVTRRLCAAGVLHKTTTNAAYVGEEIHPLHVLHTKEKSGKKHTLLYGYLPLGGFYFKRDGQAAFDSDSSDQVSAAAGEELPWPYGYRKPLNTTWLTEYTQPVVNGRPTVGFFELLRILVSRYHLGEAGIDANTALENLCDGIGFYDDAMVASNLPDVEFCDATSVQFARFKKVTLLDYLKACFENAENPLVRYIDAQDSRLDTNRNATLDRLPRADGSGSLSWRLLWDSGDAQELRALLRDCFSSQALGKIREIPLPKFGQDKDDIYQLIPFVRFRDKAGQERIQWGNDKAKSRLFRVAAPFDPEASRPSLIQMPSLRDLRRGLAKGMSVLTPPDTFNLISSLKMKKGASPDAVPDEEPGPGLGIQWLCSFSLPVVTLVAVILLMIMISLLNIVFFWLPWVRICLPFPKIEK